MIDHSGTILRTARSMEALHATCAWRYGVLRRQERRALAGRLAGRLASAALARAGAFLAALAYVLASAPLVVPRGASRGITWSITRTWRRAHPHLWSLLLLLALCGLFGLCVGSWLLLVSVEQGKNAFLWLFSVLSGSVLSGQVGQ